MEQHPYVSRGKIKVRVGREREREREREMRGETGEGEEERKKPTFTGNNFLVDSVSGSARG